MREIISVQVGECGNRVGRRFWEELCHEHCLDERNGKRLASHTENKSHDDSVVVENVDVYFDQTTDNNSKDDAAVSYLPRVILADLDSSAIDSLFSGPSGSLFRGEYSTTGYCGTGGNFAKGISEGNEILGIIEDTIRKSLESCDNCQGFQLFHSLSGGTGSGLATLIMKSIRSHYPDKMLSTSTLFPTSKPSGFTDGGILAPYNAILSMNDLIENADYVKCYDNHALYKISSRWKNNVGSNENVALEDLNGILARSMCEETASFRYSGLLNSDMRKLATNMIPFPRVHFFITSMAPFGKQSNGLDQTNLPVEELVRQLFTSSQFMASVDPKHGRYYTAASTFRGDFATSNVEEQITRVINYQSSYFFEWIPHNIQTVLCKQAPPGFKRSASQIASCSSISDYFKEISNDFSKLFRKKAFVNWYTSEGMDEMQFTEAESNVNDLVSEYVPWDHYYAEEDEEEQEPQPDEWSN